MAYSINPNLPKARATALRLLLVEGLPIQVVANRCGVHRSTVWRWHKKWQQLNQNIQQVNFNRPSKQKALQPAHYRWIIPTQSATPHSHAWAIPDEVVARVLAAREELKCCAKVVWHHLTAVLGVEVSLSCVRRILRRHHCFDGARKNRIRPENPRRPHVTKPGELVQTDTIHHVDPFSGKRMYVYTVIDLYVRMTYAEVRTRILPGLAAQAVLRAQRMFGFNFAMVQADNVPEYGRYFEEQLRRQGIPTRHSRLQRPNDNAHIEHYNRTTQTECIGYYWRRSVPLPRLQAKIDEYLDYYNMKRVRLGIQLRTPSDMLQRS